MIDVLLVGAEELENLGTRYLAAMLRRHGFTAELAAFSTPEDLEAVVAQARRLQPRLVGLSIIFQYRAPEFLALARRLKADLPTVLICAGGHFPTFVAGELLRDYPEVDCVVRGEGEYTLLELVRRLDEPATWQDILGLTFRRDGVVVENPPRPLVADLDALPFPVRDAPPQCHLGVGFAPIVGSRGCYCDCSFCSIRSFYKAGDGRAQRFRSVRNLVDEMQLLYDRGVRFFVFNDDEWFPAGKARLARVDRLSAELRRRQLDVMMSIKCRADDVEEGLFQRLRDLGVVRAYVGVESGSDGSLARLNKRTTAAQNRRAVETLQKVGMLAEFGLIFFDPDSTVADVRANLDFLRDLAAEGLAPLSFGRLEVYAGTPILARLRSEGRLHGDYMAWNYAIVDPRVELLFRLAYAALGRRQYPNEGLAKQCAIAYYELMMYRYRMGSRADPALGERLRAIVAAVNRHSLAVMEEMLAFTLTENIYDAKLVNERAIAWATEVNLFDLEWRARLAEWRAAVAAGVRAATGGDNAILLE